MLPSQEVSLLSSKSTWLILLVFGIGLLAGTVYFLFFSSESDAVDRDRMSDSTADSGTRDSSGTGFLDAADPVESTGPARVSLEPKSAEKTVAGKEEVDTFRVVMRFVDRDGGPLPGVRVELTYDGLRAKSFSGAEGRAEADFRLNRSLSSPEAYIYAELDWYVTWEHSVRVLGGGTVDLGDVVLDAAGALSGRVVDTQGVPVFAARVYCTDRSLDDMDLAKARQRGFITGDNVFTDRSKGDGSFRVCRIPLGSFRVWAGNNSFYYSHSEPIEIRAGEEVFAVEIMLDSRPAKERIECLVLTPEGIPDPFAKIKISHEHSSGGGSSTSDVDADGRFRYLVKYDVPHSIEAWNANGKYERARVDDVLPGTLNLVIQFEALRGNLRLHVRDEKGELLDSFTAEILLHDSEYASESEIHSTMGYSPKHNEDRRYSRKEFFREELDSDGIAELAAPQNAIMVRIGAEDYKYSEFGPYEGGLFPDPLQVVLHPAPGIRGRVLADGKPAAGVRVCVHTGVKPDIAYAVNQFPCRSTNDEYVCSLTDAAGCFAIPLEESGVYYLRSVIDGFAPGEVGPLEFDYLAGMSGLTINLTGGGSIEGKVKLAPGEDPEGIIVAASRGDGFPVYTVTDRSGNYSFPNLTPGRWQVEKSDKDWRDGMSRSISHCQSPPAIPWICIVIDGQTTHYDLDLTGEDD